MRTDVHIGSGNGRKVAGGKRRRRTRRIIILILTLALASVTFLYFWRKGEERTVAERRYYALCTDGYYTYGQAQIISDRLRARGAGGNIRREKRGYVVVLDMYKERATAEKKREELQGEYEGLTIVEFVMGEPLLWELDEESRILTEEALVFGRECYEALREVADRLQRGEIDENEARKRTRELRGDISEILQSYEQNLPVSYRDTDYVRINAAGKATIAVLDNLISDSNVAPNMLCDIRYSYIKIIEIEYSLISREGNVIK